MASKILALLDQVDPTAASAPRPAGTFSCALAEFGCEGYVAPQFAVFKLKDGTMVGLCPRFETHKTIAAGDPEAATIRGRLVSAFRRKNPDFVVGSKSPTKPIRVTA